MPVVLIEKRSSEVFTSVDQAQAYITTTLAVGRVGKPYHSWTVSPETDGYRAVLRFEPEDRVPVEEFDARRRAGQLPELEAGQCFIVDSL